MNLNQILALVFAAVSLVALGCGEMTIAGSLGLFACCNAALGVAMDDDDEEMEEEEAEGLAA